MLGRRPFPAIASLAALGLAVSSIGACGTTQPTSITVRVRTDLSCEDLRTVAIAVADPADIDARPPQTVTTACQVLDKELSTVGTLVVVPSGATDATVGVRVTGGVTRLADRCTADTGFKGCIVARRLVRFVPEREIEVVVDLRIDCADHACDATSTCVRGACASAIVDGAVCADSADGCGEGSLGGPGAPDGSTVGPGPGPGPSSDGGPGPNDGGGGPKTCGVDEKSCGGQCVKISDATFGCTAGACAPCPGADSSTFTCAGQVCKLGACKPGFKMCGGVCVATDVAHGCGGAACSPCDTTNGTASCTAGGACSIACANGYKSCGGKCVNVDDPTYGCSATSCDASSCPAVSAGSTLVCAAGACVIGACGAGTKACGQVCVPTDANNGCEERGRCTPCASGEQCLGSPTACTCVPEAKSLTCAPIACGSTFNNCNQNVDCPDTCPSLGTGYVCGAGGVGANNCGCVPDNVTACAGKQCGTAVNNCGQTIPCDDTCHLLGQNYACGANGAGPNACGCTPTAKSIACAGQTCGSAPTDCGGNYNCGNCFAPKFYCACGTCILAGESCQ